MSKLSAPVADNLVFNNIFGQIAMDMDPYNEGDPVGVMACLIAAFSAVIGPGPKIETLNGEMPLSFWPILVGASGAGYKGQAVKGAMKIVERTIPGYSATFVKEGFDSGLGIIQSMGDRVNTETGKHLPVLVIDQEMSKLAKQTRSDFRLNTTLTQLFDGSPLVYKTGKDDIRIPEPHLAWIGNIQPEMWLTTKGSAAAATGTWNRFFLLYIQRSKKLPTFGTKKMKAVIKAALDRAGSKLRRAFANASNVEEIHVPESVAARWEAYHRPKVDSLKRSSVGNQSERLEAYVLRLAALYAIFDGRDEICDADFDSAVAFADLSVQSVRYIASNKEFIPRTTLAQKVLDHVTDNGPCMFTAMTIKIGRAYAPNGMYWRAIHELDGEVVVYQPLRKPGQRGTVAEWVTLKDAPIPKGAVMVDVAERLASMGYDFEDSSDAADHPAYADQDEPEVVVEAVIVDDPEPEPEPLKALPGPKPPKAAERPSQATTEPPKTTKPKPTQRNGATTRRTTPHRKVTPTPAPADEPVATSWF